LKKEEAKLMKKIQQEPLFKIFFIAASYKFS
jgi:hypothetical protein